MANFKFMLVKNYLVSESPKAGLETNLNIAGSR